MTHQEALERAIGKMMNNRHRLSTYADIFEGNPTTTEKRVEVLMLRFGWSRYQSSEVLRMKREILSDDENLW